MESIRELGRRRRQPEEAVIDKTLLLRYLENDEAANFVAIYERFQQPLIAYARQHLTRELDADAEEAVQEAFVEFHKRRHKLTPETHLRGLLYRIVEHRCIDCLRRANAGKRSILKTVPLGDSHCGSVCERMDNELIDHRLDPDRNEDRLDLEAMLQTLPANQARAIRLVLLKKHTETEAAEIMGEATTTVTWWIKDGRQRLKQLAARNRNPE